ncbi:hypothetical protein ACIBL3_13970 [Kribbella sp. NPDC050124]|uniref:hypothetical protein n=1 Tax=Kribbella sp. NPDC050124 TaxID=3364114 RepID=UPI0037B67FC5
MLGLSETAIGWLEGRRPADGVSLPDDDRAVQLLEFCGVSEQDRDDMLAARPDRSRDAGWCTLQRAFVTHLGSGRHWAKRTGIRLPAAA